MKDFGTISAIDLNRRAPIYSVELAVDLSRARAMLGRAADVDNDHIVSWGHLTNEEVFGLALCEDDEHYREDLLIDLKLLASMQSSSSITLYFRMKSDG